MSQAKKFNELINNTFEISQTIDGVKTVYVSGDDTKLYVNKHFGNAYCYYDNTTDLKVDFDHFNRLHVSDFIRLLKALQFEYNPCENFDKYSDITVTHSGTIGTTNNSTVTSKVNAFDSQSLVTDGENVANGGNTTTLNNSDGTIEHTHGNIGVQTVSNMILQSGTGEAYLRFNSFVEHYINRWISGCIVGYGDEENEIEYAPSTEYATKTELETLAQSTSDALNSLTNTVNSHGESINTLDASLGSVIEQVEEIGGVLEDHETRIETLENAPTPSSEVIYSTEERKIGKWLDNSDLYQITIVTTIPSAITDGSGVNYDIPFNHNIKNIYGIFDNGAKVVHKFPYIDGSTTTSNTVKQVRVSQYNNNIRVSNSFTSMNGRTAYITIEYTK